MTGWRPDFNPDHLYFVTSSAVQHRHLFRRDVIKRLVVDSLDCIRLRERLKLYVFVIMPNHLHVIIQCRTKDPLAGLRGWRSRFMMSWAHQPGHLQQTVGAVASV